MAAIAVQMNAEPIAGECYQSKVRALTDVITCHAARCRRIALGRLSNDADAEDVVQDAVLSALTHVHQFRGQSKMSTWFTTIVINSARMKLRRRLAFTQVALDDIEKEQDFVSEIVVPDTRPDPEEACYKRELAEILAHATSCLSPTLRATFQLRDVEGLSIREAAELLGVPIGTVKARLARARLRLREAMSKSVRRKRDARKSRGNHSLSMDPSRAVSVQVTGSRKPTSSGD